MRKILIAFMAVLGVFSFMGMVSAGEESKEVIVQKRANDAALRALYDNKERFEMLSSAAQALLERKFGERKEIAVDPPAAPKATSPQSPNAVITNVLVNNPAADATAQDTQSETTISLAGPNIVGSFNDSGSYNGVNNHFTGWGYSTDGGATFTDGGALPNSAEGDAGDPVLARNDTTGRLYLTTLGFNTGQVLQSFRSDNNGVSWMAPVSLGNTGAGDFQDKEWITVDNYAGTGLGNVYVAWRSFGDGIYFVRSTDHGATFSAPAQLAPEGAFNVQGAYVAVAPDHSVHVFWLDQSAGAGTAHISKTRKSTDGGVTFGGAVNIRTFTGVATNGGLALGGGFRTNGFPHVAINPVSGHIYVVYADDVSGADKGDIFLSRSTDGGATWASQNVTDLFDSGTNDDFSATVAVTPDGNRLMVAWYDRELDPANNLIDYFGAIADTSGGGLTFGPQFRITTESFPVIIGQDPVINTVYMGDYDQIVADNSFFYLTWGDNRGSSTAHTNQPDAMFAKIPVTGPGAILTVGTVNVDDSTGNNNGDVEFNECVGLTVGLKNSGTSIATGVTGTLSTSTPGVTVTTPNSNYPDINPGGTQNNSTPFQFQTSPSFVCGTAIDFTLQVNTSSNAPSGGASFTLTFSIPTGGLGSSTQFDNNTSTPIPDVSTINIPFNVSGFSGSIGKVTLSMHATHTWAGDMDVSLVAPNGAIVELSTDNGGNGDNYGTACSPESSRTTFDDDAATSIVGVPAPFAGTFRPEGSLADFIGLSGTDVNGTWNLRITDDVSLDVGNFLCASLFLSSASCTDGGGPCTACAYSDLFDDGTVTYTVVKPNVTETGGYLTLTPTTKKAYATSTGFAGMQNGTITSEIQYTAVTDPKGKAWMFTHWVDKKHLIEVMLNFTRNKVVVKQKDGVLLARAKGDFTFAPDTLYTVEANYDGTDYEVRVNGTLVVTLTPVGTIPSGILGYAARGLTEQVNSVCQNP